MARIFFDGYNLGLKRGTGVATYARMLARMTRTMGHRTGLVYGPQRGIPRNPLEREVAFFDDSVDLKPPTSLRVLKELGTIGNLLGAGLGIAPHHIPQNNVVVTRPFGSSWVDCDELYASHSLFEVARRFFVMSGHLLPLQFSPPPALFHWTYPIPLRARGAANIYTVHDLVPVRFPYTTLDWKRYYIRSMREILAKADHIVTVSENSKRDIADIFGIEERRITTTFQAVGYPPELLHRHRDELAEELAGVFGLEDRGYLLFYGSLEPKKNIARTVQAYLSANVKLPLVMVVAQNWQAEDEARLLNQILEEDRTYDRSKERRRIRRYEYLPFRLMTSLIQGAAAVVFPSLYEGFGLPVLEAMTLGTPVITANTSSLPEVAGDACLSIDPYDVDALRQAMVNISESTALRAELVEKGLAQAELFSPEIYRKRIEALYARFL